MANAPTASQATKDVKPICGIIMPISAMPPTYEASHWSDVRKIFDLAITKAGMTPQIVSDSFESDVIQQRIISNLYDNPVVVCDVSGLNPNVMFELGMRITFKQPVIIVTDDFASIPFDTKVIEHLHYPRDLHIHLTNEFIDKLADRISTLHAQKKDGSFKSFIEAFGTFEVLEPTKKVVEADQLILDRLDDLDRSIRRMNHSSNPYKRDLNLTGSSRPELRIDLNEDASEADVVKVIDSLRSIVPASSVNVSKGPKGQVTISFEVPDQSDDTFKMFQSRLKRTFAHEKAANFSLRYA